MTLKQSAFSSICPELILTHTLNGKYVFKLLQGKNDFDTSSFVCQFKCFLVFRSLIKLGRIALDYILFELDSNTKVRSASVKLPSLFTSSKTWQFTTELNQTRSQVYSHTTSHWFYHCNDISLPGGRLLCFFFSL